MFDNCSTESGIVEPSPLPPVRTLLVVDDNDVARITTKWFMANFGYAVESARSAEEALRIFTPSVHDLVITDNSMPGMTGAQMARLIKEQSPSTPILMYTGNPPDDTACLDDVIQRPTHLLEVKAAVDRLLETRSTSPPAAS